MGAHDPHAFAQAHGLTPEQVPPLFRSLTWPLHPGHSFSRTAHQEHCDALAVLMTASVGYGSLACMPARCPSEACQAQQQAS